MAVRRKTKPSKEVTHMRTIVRKTAQALAVAAPVAFLVVETAGKLHP
jgi:hypothetical protein